MKNLILAVLILFSFKSYAWIADLNADIISESFSTKTEQTSSRQFISFSALGDVGKTESARYYLGWGVISATAKDAISSPSVDQSFATLDMGPTFRMHFDKNGLYCLSFTYAIFGKGTLTTAGVSEAIRGSSYHLKFSIEPQVTERLFIGFSLNYFAASYNKSVVNAVETDVSYKVTRMFPMLALSYRY